MTETWLTPDTIRAIFPTILVSLPFVVTFFIWAADRLNRKGPLTTLSNYYDNGHRAQWSALALIAIIVAIWLPLFATILWGLWEMVRTLPEMIALARRPVDPQPIPVRYSLLGITALTAALGATVAFPFTVLRTRYTARQTTATEQGLITDRINKAVEGLGAEKTVKRIVTQPHADGTEQKESEEETRPNIEVRIGAIYALERIAKDSERDHIQIMEILCAYIRENAPAADAQKIPEGEWPDYPQETDTKSLKEYKEATDDFGQSLDLWATTLRLDHKPRADIQTALSVLGRRDPNRIDGIEDDAYRGHERYRLDLRATNLQAADLSHLDLRFAQLNETKMQGANLSWAKMQGAFLSQAKMQGADHDNAKMQGVDLSFAEMQRARLSGANMQGANLSQTMMQGALLIATQMQRAQLMAANMQKADLSRAMMQRANLSQAEMQEADLSQAMMQEAFLSQAMMQGANLSQAMMQEAFLSQAMMQGADLSEAGLQKVDLSWAKMQRADLSWAEMQDADLSRAEMQGADLSYAEMQGVVLTDANLRSVNWSGLKIDSTSVQFIDLRDVRGLTQDHLSSLIGNAATLLPDDANLYVPNRWETEPPNWQALVASNPFNDESKMREKYLCAPGQTPQKTGTPWPADRDPPWVELGISVDDWVEQQPTRGPVSGENP